MLDFMALGRNAEDKKILDQVYQRVQEEDQLLTPAKPVEVSPGLIVGNEEHLSQLLSQPEWGAEWFAISACKTHHQTMVGYTGNLEQDHPEYLIAERENHIALNIVDAADPALFEWARPAILQTLVAIETVLSEGRRVLLHCNAGISRSPSIAMLYLHMVDELIFRKLEHSVAKENFQKNYPYYSPRPGIDIHLYENWDWYSEQFDDSSLTAEDFAERVANYLNE